MARTFDIGGTPITAGAATALLFSRNRERRAFVDRVFDEAGHARRLGLVSHVPTVLGQLSVQENLGLVRQRAVQARRFWQELAKARSQTGLLDNVAMDSPADKLSWRQQLELNFLQAWMLEPECLVFDRVFDDEDEEMLTHLPALFRARFPLRTICYLQQKGRMPSVLQVHQVIELT